MWSMSAQTGIDVSLMHCLPDLGLQPSAWWITLWFLYCVHDVCGAQSPPLSHPRGIQPGANISQGNIYHESLF